MAYSAEISRVNPTCFLFLIDQSGSMAECWGGERARPRPEESPTPSGSDQGRSPCPSVEQRFCP